LLEDVVGTLDDGEDGAVVVEPGWMAKQAPAGAAQILGDGRVGAAMGRAGGGIGVEPRVQLGAVVLEGGVDLAKAFPRPSWRNPVEFSSTWTFSLTWEGI
jgi:hypothetical protein